MSRLTAAHGASDEKVSLLAAEVCHIDRPMSVPPQITVCSLVWCSPDAGVSYWSIVVYGIQGENLFANQSIIGLVYTVLYSVTERMILMYTLAMLYINHLAFTGPVFRCLY